MPYTRKQIRAAYAAKEGVGPMGMKIGDLILKETNGGRDKSMVRKPVRKKGR